MDDISCSSILYHQGNFTDDVSMVERIADRKKEMEEEEEEEIAVAVPLTPTNCLLLML